MELNFFIEQTLTEILKEVSAAQKHFPGVVVHPTIENSNNAATGFTAWQAVNFDVKLKVESKGGGSFAIAIMSAFTAKADKNKVEEHINSVQFSIPIRFPETTSSEQMNSNKPKPMRKKTGPKIQPLK